MGMYNLQSQNSSKSNILLGNAKFGMVYLNTQYFGYLGTMCTKLQKIFSKRGRGTCFCNPTIFYYTTTLGKVLFVRIYVLIL